MAKRAALVLFLFCITRFIASAVDFPQAATLRWMTYGGAGNDSANIFGPLPNGEWLLGGQSSSYEPSGHKTVPGIGQWLLKLDNDGNILSQALFESFVEFGHTGLGGELYFVGNSWEGLGWNVEVTRLTPAAEVLWQSIHDREYRDHPAAFATTPFGDSYLLIRSGPQTASDFSLWLIKTLANGTNAWQKVLPPAQTNRFDGASTHSTMIAAAPDGGCVIAAKRSLDVLLMRFGPDGSLLWQKSIWAGPWPSYSQSRIKALFPIAGGFFLGADNRGPSGAMDANVLLLDEEGETIWQRSYGGAGEEFIEAVATNHLGYVVSTQSSSPADGVKRSAPNKASPPSADRWVLILDHAGNVLGEASFPAPRLITHLFPRTSTSYFAASLPRFSSGPDLFLGVLDLQLQPLIVRHPQNASGLPGSTLNLGVDVLSPAPNMLRFQWQKDGGAITGATNQQLTFSPLTAAAIGRYSVEVSNEHGSVVSQQAELRLLDVQISWSVDPTLALRITGKPGEYNLVRADLPTGPWDSVERVTIGDIPLTWSPPGINSTSSYYTLRLAE